MRALIDLLFPRSCIACGSASSWTLCDPCYAAFPWNRSACARCACPLARPAPTCADCARLRPAFRAARSAAVYDGVARAALMAFKLGGERRAGPSLAALTYEAASRLDHDVVTYVPSSRAALAERGFDPAREIAVPLARMTGRPLVGALTRVRRTEDQASLSRDERRRNLAGAFGSAPVDGTVLLVDDVMTTGATADACARALRAAGAREVVVSTFARAP